MPVLRVDLSRYILNANPDDDSAVLTLLFLRFIDSGQCKSHSRDALKALPLLLRECDGQAQSAQTVISLLSQMPRGIPSELDMFRSCRCLHDNKAVRCLFQLLGKWSALETCCTHDMNAIAGSLRAALVEYHGHINCHRYTRQTGPVRRLCGEMSDFRSRSLSPEDRRLTRARSPTDRESGGEPEPRLASYTPASPNYSPTSPNFNPTSQ